MLHFMQILKNGDVLIILFSKLKKVSSIKLVSGRFCLKHTHILRSCMENVVKDLALISEKSQNVLAPE